MIKNKERRRYEKDARCMLFFDDGGDIIVV